MKKLFAIIMSMLMTFCFMPAAAFAASSTDCASGDDCKHVASITSGDETTHYETLADAIDGAEEGSTITLLKKVTVTSTVDITKGVTINMNEKTITGDGCRVFHVRSGGDLNVTGEGIITSVNVNDHTKSVVRVGDSGEANFTMGEDVTIEAPGTYGVTIFGTGTQSMKIDGTVNCTYGSDDACAVAGQGSEQYNAGGVQTTITIGSTAELTTANDVAIYKPNTGVLTIEDGANIKGLGGIEVKAGEVVISGNPTITATAETQSNKYNGDGSSTKGYAVSVMNIEANGGYKGKANVTIEGGTFTGDVAILDNVKNGGVVDESKKGQITITGGTFSTDPSAYVKENGTNYFVKRAGEEGSYTYTVLAKGNLTTGVYLKDPSSALTGRYYISDTNGGNGPWTVSYRSGSGSSSSTTTTTDNVTNTTEDKTTGTGSTTETSKVEKTTATVKSETKTNANGTKTTTATVDSTTATKIVEKAVENKSEEVVIDTAAAPQAGTTAVTETAAGTTTEVALPEQTVKAIASETEAAVTIKSDAAEVKLDAEAVKAVADQSGDLGTVSLVVETVAQSESKVEVDLKLVTSKGSVTEFKGGSVSVTVKLNTALVAKPVVCVYIDNFGTYHKVSGQKNADGTYTFVTGHFSSYAVMAEEDADKVIAEQTENVEKLVESLSIKARSAKTEKGSIAVTLTVDEDAIKQIEGLGYTVKYKFYRSTKKAASYKAKYEKAGLTYTNTAGTKGTRYYYKARVMVYDAQGALIAKTELKQCKYACRVK